MLKKMQSVRDVLRQSAKTLHSRHVRPDAIRAGCAEAKVLPFAEKLDVHDAIRAGVFRSRR